MQKDFHYYCIAVLADLAGYTQEQARKIAYASAFVDDQNRTNQFNGKNFKPIVTAHKGLEMVQYKLSKKDNINILLPFHFLPDKDSVENNNSFVVKQFPNLAEELFNEATKEPDFNFQLIRIGVALHTIADTWAHQGFSGMEDDENKITKLSMKEHDNWLKKQPHPDIINIGHAMADCLPDNPSICWQYSYCCNETTLHTINNFDRFIDAAEKIYKLLSSTGAGESVPWEDVKESIEQNLKFYSQDVEERCEQWVNRFDSLFKDNIYDNRKWWYEMMPRGYRKDEWLDISHNTSSKKFSLPTNESFEQQNWVLFNKAAKLQQKYVLNNLPIQEKARTT